MKRKIIKMSVILTCIVVLLVIFNLVMKNHFSLSVVNDLPPNFSELLNKEYGKSEHYQLEGNISLDVEKFIQNKYYIEYSFINGDQSSTSFVLLVEEKDKNPLINLSLEKIRIVDSEGNIFYPRNYYLEDFPLDMPLEYKKKLVIIFNMNKENYPIKLTLEVNGNEYSFIIDSNIG